MLASPQADKELLLVLIINRIVIAFTMRLILLLQYLFSHIALYLHRQHEYQKPGI